MADYLQEQEDETLTQSPLDVKKKKRGVGPMQDPNRMYDESGSDVGPADERPGPLKSLGSPMGEEPKVEESLDAKIKRLQDAKLRAINDLPENAQEYYADKFNELSDERADALQAYKSSQDRVEKAQLAETIGHALAQLGAAQQGLKSGVDMSGVKFNKTDWESRYNRLLKDLDVQLGDIKARKGEVKETQEDRYTKDKSLAREKIGNYEEDIRDLMSQRRNQTDELERGSKEKAKALRDEDKQLQQQELHLQQASGTLQQLDEGTIKKKDAAMKQLNDDLSFGAGKTPVARKDTWFGLSSTEDWAGTKGGVDKSLEEVKKRRQEIKAEMAGKAPAAPKEEGQAPAAAAGMVKMQSPDGKMGSIPAAKVQEAEAAGFKRVQ